MSNPVFHVFKSAMSSMRMVLPNGQVLNFHGGEAVTSDERIAAYLKKEIASGTPNLFQDQEDSVRTAEKIDPMVAIRAAIRDELIREMNQQNGDMGNSEQERLTPASSANIEPLTTQPVVKNVTSAEAAAELLTLLGKTTETKA